MIATIPAFWSSVSIFFTVGKPSRAVGRTCSRLVRHILPKGKTIFTVVLVTDTILPIAQGIGKITPPDAAVILSIIKIIPAVGGIILPVAGMIGSKAKSFYQFYLPFYQLVKSFRQLEKPFQQV